MLFLQKGDHVRIAGRWLEVIEVPSVHYFYTLEKITVRAFGKYHQKKTKKLHFVREVEEHRSKKECDAK